MVTPDGVDRTVAAVLPVRPRSAQTCPGCLATLRGSAFDQAVDKAAGHPPQLAVCFGGHSARLEDVTMDVRRGGAWSARTVLEGGRELR